MQTKLEKKCFHCISFHVSSVCGCTVSPVQENLQHAELSTYLDLSRNKWLHLLHSYTHGYFNFFAKEFNNSICKSL